MKLHLGLKLLLMVGLVLSGTMAHAQEDASSDNLPLVEVEIAQDNLAPYRERKENTGIYFAIAYEALELKNFLSTLDNATYGSIFGSEALPLIHASFDYKLNTFLGSWALGLDYGMGDISSSLSGQNRKLEISKYGVGAKWVLDNLTEEPYVAPYVGINFWQMGIKETSPTDSFSATTQMGYNYSLGLLIQLDWIDYSTAKNSTFDWGLENTFIDVYATQYAKTSAVDDPNTETDFLYGAGLRLEF